ncbi:hypothetical protein BDA96_05G169200 [Sorghum bicolor]|uniref:Uncharacterized protein n=1 Tax=Sorghum bicolor TaxID=4558 RepID=A0A921UHM2_SORBI|nr:hypothetical protein BDA96_05G169200 [Sorghum bicolor]
MYHLYKWLIWHQSSFPATVTENKMAKRIVLIWKYIQKHIQTLLDYLGPIYLQWQHTVQR